VQKPRATTNHFPVACLACLQLTGANLRILYRTFDHACVPVLRGIAFYALYKFTNYLLTYLLTKVGLAFLDCLHGSWTWTRLYWHWRLFVLVSFLFMATCASFSVSYRILGPISYTFNTSLWRKRNERCLTGIAAGWGPAQATIRNGGRWGTYNAFLKRTLSRDNVHILTHAVAQKVDRCFCWRNTCYYFCDKITVSKQLNQLVIICWHV